MGPVLTSATGGVAGGVAIVAAWGAALRGCGRVLLGGAGVIEPSHGALTAMGRLRVIGIKRYCPGRSSVVRLRLFHFARSSAETE